ncbi:hypothetical protein [Tengunoibacter tsumagoiensis]|uniref:Uncharacterized protein n=1 Tax=Tengunoibacter tsumagoiensis TaxID=2014871 RepID=A0A401ZZS8_9CHLR|nr:hypothetical protein [Tengunoibacter tsumagoiensis]GCE12301.1 hypothetical protein KTT_21600 [Tengunoibacter tsumagoiensis]
MQQVQQRELPERISWARAIIFAVGFFFIAAILIGQLPSYIYIQLTASSLQGFEIGTLGLGVVCLAGFAVIEVIVLLFDPKPVLPPILFTGAGAVLAVLGLILSIVVTTTGCTPANHDCNQYFPTASTDLWSVWGGKFLWFQPKALDLLTIGLALLGVGVATIFYSILARREQHDSDRRDLGFTPGARWMMIGSILLLIVFLVAYTMNNEAGWGAKLLPGHPFAGLKLATLLISIVLGSAIFLAFGAFALRLHYLMRPIRKKTMPALYMIGALGLAQLGAILLLAWFFVYPLIAWVHGWTFIGLGSFLTLCSKADQIPASCSFSADAGYLADAIVTMNFFILFMAGIWGWKSHRNIVVITGVVLTAVLAFTALLMHTAPDQLVQAMMLCVAILVLATIWAVIARNEFAVIGENNLGCLGMWLVVGTCLFIYIGAFGFFSIPSFADEIEPNITFAPGASIDAFVVLIITGILAAVHFYFLTRNRYKV